MARGLKCLSFTRSKSSNPDSPDRSPLNDRTAYIDGSTVYGHTANFNRFVRDRQRPEFLAENARKDENDRAFPPFMTGVSARINRIRTDGRGF